MTNEHTTLNSLFTDIADSIRAKTGSEDSIKADNFPSAIMDIPTASGGLHLDTELILTADTTETVGPVTLTAVLTANYDDITPSDVDLHGFLEGATITFYDENGTSLYSGITNENGTVVANITLTKTSIIYCSFTGTSDYDSCISNNISIEFSLPLYNPLLDGTESITLLDDASGNLTVKNGIMGGTGIQKGYLSDGWDNSGNWELTANVYYSKWDGGILLLLHPFTLQDGLLEQYNNPSEPNKTGIRTSSPYGTGFFYKFNPDQQLSNINWTTSAGNINIKFIKQQNILSYYENNVFKGSITLNALENNPRAYIGMYSWGSKYTLENIVVTHISN